MTTTLSFTSLPGELLVAIAEWLPQGAKNELCRTCRRLRQHVEPLLYQSVTARDVTASARFQQIVKQDRERAAWVREFSLEYQTEQEWEDDEQDDCEVLLYLPNLESLALETAYRDEETWEDVWTRALHPDPSQRILGHLKTCSLQFMDDEGESWGPDVSMDVLGLPSLEHLTLVRWGGGDIRLSPSLDTKTLPPLKTLVLVESDFDPGSLKELLQVRPVQALSVMACESLYEPEDYREFAEYWPALKVGAATLEALQWGHYWDSPDWSEADWEDELAPHRGGLAGLRALRLLFINPENLFNMGDAEVLFLDRAGKDRTAEWLRTMLPPNLETLLFDVSECGLSGDLLAILKAAWRSKDAVLPKLRRIEFLGMKGDARRRLHFALRSVSTAANVQLGFYETDYQARWAMHVAEHRDLAVDIRIGSLPPGGGGSVEQRFFARGVVHSGHRAFNDDGRDVSDYPALLSEGLHGP